MVHTHVGLKGLEHYNESAVWCSTKCVSSVYNRTIISGIIGKISVFGVAMLEFSEGSGCGD